MPTTNKKSAEEFLAALIQQKNFEGIVEDIGYVKCQKDDVWLVPMQPSPGMPQGKAVPSPKYTVSIERIDKARQDDNTPYFKKRFPDLTKEEFAEAITSPFGNNKVVQIGDRLCYELLASQHISVNIDFTMGTVTMRLPDWQDRNGETYPKYLTSRNGPYSLSNDRKENTVSLDDIQQGLLGYAAKYLLIGDQEITSKPYTFKVDYWDMLQNFGEYRPYIFGNKFTISFSLEGSAVIGGGGSVDFTWLFDGVDRSAYPYSTITLNAIGSTGGGVSGGVSAGFGSFVGDPSELNRASLKGLSRGAEFTGIFGVGGGIGGSQSFNTNAIWYNGYISVDIGGDASPVTGASYKAFVGWTSETLHISPEKLVKYVNQK